MYQSEVNVAEESVYKFMEIAEDLRIKGIEKLPENIVMSEKENIKNLKKKSNSVQRLYDDFIEIAEEKNIKNLDEERNSFPTSTKNEILDNTSQQSENNLARKMNVDIQKGDTGKTN